MFEQVIIINDDGSIETLRQKKGQGVDLREFGAVEMQRVSNVHLDEGTQKYYVEFIAGALAGHLLTHGIYAVATNSNFSIMDCRNMIQFDEYEDAVEAEVKTLNAVAKEPERFKPQTLQFVSSVLVA